MSHLLLPRIRSACRRAINIPFVKNVGVLSGGMALAQGISLLATPVITRLFSPESMGLLALFMWFTGFLRVFSSLSYEHSIVLPAKHEDGASILVLTGLLLLGISLCCFIPFTLLGGPIAAALNNPGMERWLWLVPIAVFLTGIGQNTRFWMIRIKAFRLAAISGLALSASFALTKIGCGVLVRTDAAGLIGATLVGLLLIAVLVLWLVLKTDSQLRTAMRKVTWHRLKEQAATYRNFPRIFCWTRLLNFGSQECVIILFGVLYSPAIVGLYHLGKRLLQQPSAFVGDSVAQVYLQKASEQVSHRRMLLADLTKVTLTLFGLGLLPFAILTIFGESLFAWGFGENWAEAGLYVQILAPFVFVRFINSPASTVWVVLQKLREQFILNLLLTGARLAAILLGWILYESPLASLALFSAVGVSFNIWYIVMGFVYAWRADRDSAGTNRPKDEPTQE